VITSGQQIVHGLGVDELHKRKPSGLSGKRVGLDIDVLDLTILREVLAQFFLADGPT